MRTEKLTDPESTGSHVGKLFPDENPIVGKFPRAKYFFRKLFADYSARKYLIILASVSIFAFAIAAGTGLFGEIEDWAQLNNLSNYHLGEFPTLIVVLALAATIFLIYRHQEMRDYLKEVLKPGSSGNHLQVQPSLHDKELEYRFQQVEKAKKEWEQSLDSIRDMVILSDLDGTIHRCNRAFKEFVGLPYEEIVRENIASLLMKFEINLNSLDMNALNARFHISGKWFGVKSFPYTDFEKANNTRIVIIVADVSASRAPGEKVQFVWGRTEHTRSDNGQAALDNSNPKESPPMPR